MSEHLDELMLSYLDTIDTYQSLRTSLSSRFSAGFLALAQANFHSTSGRYGQDSYDERMSALRGVEIREGGDGTAFKSKKVEVEREGGEKDKKEKGNEGGEEEIENVENVEDKKSIKRPDHRDPIRWFGILVPPALRTVQSEFASAVETDIPQLLTTLSKLSSLEFQVNRIRTKYMYKILIAAPPSPLPEALPLSPLDKSSGFIHLCTATQIPGVISMFMGSAEKLWLLKIPYEKIKPDLKWEGIPGSGGRGEKFPHLFNLKLGVDEVEDWKEFERDSKVGWDGVFDNTTWLQK